MSILNVILEGHVSSTKVSEQITVPADSGMSHSLSPDLGGFIFLLGVSQVAW